MKDSDILSKSVILKAIGNAKRLEILHHINKEELSVEWLCVAATQSKCHLFTQEQLFLSF